MRKIIAAARAMSVAGALALSLGACTSARASASTGPVVYAGMGCWSLPRVRPGTIDLGADYWLSDLGWHSWGSGHANGFGRDNWSNGAAGQFHHYHVTVTLSRVRRHDGRGYFSEVKMSARGRADETRFAECGWL